MYVLTDYDPDGLSIAAVYATSSRALAHEGQRLMLTRLRWIGARSEDVVTFMSSNEVDIDAGGSDRMQGASQLQPAPNEVGTSLHTSAGNREDAVETEQSSSESASPDHPLLRLTERNRQRARAMLARSLMRSDAGDVWPEWETWRRELQVMLMLNVKAEMQILEQRDEGLRGWLDGKLGL
jgi:meiotic recombination protein SPO11